MTAIDGRLYVDGRPIPCPSDLEDAADDLERSGGVAWIGLMDPGPDELETAAARFGLHPLAVEDAQKGHQRAKLERYGETMFVVLRPASYDDGTSASTSVKSTCSSGGNSSSRSGTALCLT